MNDWQPIATAPKEKSLLAAINTDWGYYFEVLKLRDDGEAYSPITTEHLFERSWYCEPTHWMPLPEPPKP